MLGITDKRMGNIHHIAHYPEILYGVFDASKAENESLETIFIRVLHYDPLEIENTYILLSEFSNKMGDAKNQTLFLIFAFYADNVLTTGAESSSTEVQVITWNLGTTSKF